MTGGIKIYVEGANVDSKEAKAAMARGLNGLLKAQKDAARARRLHWDVVFCGDGLSAYKAFKNGLKDAGRVAVLLVDSESAIAKETGDKTVDAKARLDHLRKSGCCTELSENLATHVHLMVQTMETWICADLETLVGYYGKGFIRGAISRRTDLEEESKVRIAAALDQATSKSASKGQYHKINHGSQLLARIRPEIVAKRCPRFGTLTRWLDSLIPKL